MSAPTGPEEREEGASATEAAAPPPPEAPDIEDGQLELFPALSDQLTDRRHRLL